MGFKKRLKCETLSEVLVSGGTECETLSEVLVSGGTESGDTSVVQVSESSVSHMYTLNNKKNETPANTDSILLVS